MNVMEDKRRRALIFEGNGAAKIIILKPRGELRILMVLE